MPTAGDAGCSRSSFQGHADVARLYGGGQGDSPGLCQGSLTRSGGLSAADDTPGSSRSNLSG